MDDDLLALRIVDTPAICNAVEVVQVWRGTEALVLELARWPSFDFAALKIAWAAFEKART